MYDFTTIGALIGMALAIVLIIRKFHPAYSLIIGALVGGVIQSVRRRYFLQQILLNLKELGTVSTEKMKHGQLRWLSIL